MGSSVGVVITTLLASIVGSAGFWAFLESRKNRHGASTRLMMGLAYSRSVELGMFYIRRGFITAEELGDFRKYLYDPYIALGGNGALDRIMDAIQELPLQEKVD